jgi:hypothetical protein
MSNQAEPQSPSGDDATLSAPTSPWQSGRDARLWRHLAAIIITALVVVYASQRAPNVRNSPKQLTSGFIKHYPAQGPLAGLAFGEKAIGINNRRMSCTANMWAATPTSCASLVEGTFASIEWLEMPGVFQTYPLALVIEPEAGATFRQTQADLNRSAFLSSWPLLLPLGLVLWMLLRKPKMRRASRYY